MIKESPVNIECIVKEIKELGSHHMFISEVVAVNADEEYIDGKRAFSD
jgi:flavin reductase (DIM6/NTAB) family NADH-FMN oxidoreductase RutF